jgi:DNA-binding NarL/FixJ family response regulator
MGHSNVGDRHINERVAELTMSEPIRVLIVDDHPGVAEVITQVLALDPAIAVIGIEPTGSQGIVRASTDAPDVVVMDFALPDMTGAEATAALMAAQPDVRVVGVTASNETGAYEAAVRSGISAWVLKKDIFHELRDAIHRVFAGERLVPDYP